MLVQQQQKSWTPTESQAGPSRILFDKNQFETALAALFINSYLRTKTFTFGTQKSNDKIRHSSRRTRYHPFQSHPLSDPQEEWSYQLAGKEATIPWARCGQLPDEMGVVSSRLVNWRMIRHYLFRLLQYNTWAPNPARSCSPRVILGRDTSIQRLWAW